MKVENDLSRNSLSENGVADANDPSMGP